MMDLILFMVLTNKEQNYLADPVLYLLFNFKGFYCLPYIFEHF